MNIRSKNELAKRIADNSQPYQECLLLINDVMRHFDAYWYDSCKSEPDNGKFVRSAAGKNNPLGKLLKLINNKILASCDNLIPDFIYGGISGRSHIKAAHSLLGCTRKRILLGLDVVHFFEQIREERVFFFLKRCGCASKVAKLIAYISCVNLGPKGNLCEQRNLARGFATSSRLAIWCNINIFNKLNWKIKKMLRNHDPQIAIFVDDIGISASRVGDEQMKKVLIVARDILAKFDHNQKLPIKEEKTKICLFCDGAEHLGLRLGKKLSMGQKTRIRRNEIYKALKKEQPSSLEKNRLLNQKRAYCCYKKQILNVR